MANPGEYKGGSWEGRDGRRRDVRALPARRDRRARVRFVCECSLMIKLYLAKPLTQHLHSTAERTGCGSHHTRLLALLKT